MIKIYIKNNTEASDEYTYILTVKKRINNRIEDEPEDEPEDESEYEPEDEPEDDQFNDMVNDSNDNSSDASSDVSTEDLSDKGKKKRLFEMIDDINETESKIHNICSSKCPDIAEILKTRMIRSLKRYRKLYEDIYGPINKKNGAILIA